MKTIFFKSGLILAATAMMMTACDTDRDDNPILDTSNMTSEFVLNTPAYSTQLVDLASSSTVNFTWSQPNYGFAVPTTYSFQLSLDGNFKDAVLDENGDVTTPATYSDLKGSFTTVSGGISASEINRAIVELSGWETETEVPASITAFVRAKAVLLDQSVPPVYSNTVQLMFVPSFKVAPQFAEYIYMMGNFNGWSDPVYMRSLTDAEGNFTSVYRCFNYLDGGFKFRPNVDNWDNDFGQNDAGALGELITDGEVDCNTNSFDGTWVPGFYMIEVDMEAMQLTVTPVTSISIIGTVNGSWDTDTDLTYNTETGAWEGTATLTAGEMKFRMNHDWTISWGGVNGDGTAYGNLTHNDGANLVLDADGTYFVQLFIQTEGNNRVVITKQ